MYYYKRDPEPFPETIVLLVLQNTINNCDTLRDNVPQGIIVNWCELLICPIWYHCKICTISETVYGISKWA